MTSITIVRESAPDWRGYPTGDAVEFVEDGWVLAPRSLMAGGANTEDTFRAAQSITGLTGYGPIDTVLRASDQVCINGELWDVDGEVGRWVSPYPGSPSGCQASFEKVTG